MVPTVTLTTHPLDRLDGRPVAARVRVRLPDGQTYYLHAVRKWDRLYWTCDGQTYHATKLDTKRQAWALSQQAP